MISIFRKKITYITAVLGLLLFTAFLCAGRLLVLDEPPQQADVIIILSGDRGTRTEHGVELYQQGYAPYLMVSGGQVYHETTMAGLMAAHAQMLGVPARAIITESLADSTYENALFTRELMEQYGFTSALVVSSNYHMQRVRFTYQRVFNDTGIKLTYSAAREPDYNPGRWWANNRSIMLTFNEYVKFIGYALGRNL